MVGFAHVGLHKTATTWLQRLVFPSHPQLEVIGAHKHLAHADPLVYQLVATDDVRFDAVDWKKGFQNAVCPAHTPEKLLGVSCEALSGDMVTGSGCAQAARRLASLFPGLKVLLVLREPRSYVLSVYSQYVKRGGSLPFHAFLQDKTIPGLGLAAKIDYQSQVLFYNDVFGAENVLVLPYELLVKSNQAFLDAVVPFLQIAPFPALGEWKRNQSLSPRGVELLRLMNFQGKDPWKSQRFVRMVDARLLSRLRTRKPSLKLPEKQKFWINPQHTAAYGELSSRLKNEYYELWSGPLAGYNYRFE
jgi:hypothetical protein